MDKHRDTPTAVLSRDRHEPEEQPPIWRNTRPRGNAETDRRDLERGIERMESVLGR